MQLWVTMWIKMNFVKLESDRTFNLQYSTNDIWNVSDITEKKWYILGTGEGRYL